MIKGRDADGSRRVGMQEALSLTCQLWWLPFPGEQCPSLVTDSSFLVTPSRTESKGKASFHLRTVTQPELTPVAFGLGFSHKDDSIENESG